MTATLQDTTLEHNFLILARCGLFKIQVVLDLWTIMDPGISIISQDGHKLRHQTQFYDFSFAVVIKQTPLLLGEQCGH